MLNIRVQKTSNPKAKPAAGKLGFGQYFSDHMFVVDYLPEQGWVDPRIVPYGPLSLDPAASVLHYGQAMFEGMKAFCGVDQKMRLFRPDFHCGRLARGAPRICMPPVPQEIMMQGIEALIRVDQDWSPQAVGSSLYLRPTLIGTEAFLGVRASQKYVFFIIMSPVDSYYAEGVSPVRIHVEDKLIRAAPGGLGDVKAGANYAASILASTEAKKSGFAQVLWLDAVERKYIEEVGTMNVFFALGEKIKPTIVTPPLAGTILDGATRSSTIQVLRDLGYTVEERKLSMDEVVAHHQKGTLREAFGTGTAAVISPVGELHFKGEKITINGFKPGDLAQKLYEEITSIQYGKKSDRFGWTKEVALD